MYYIYTWYLYVTNLTLVIFLIYLQNEYLWVFFEISSFDYLFRLKNCLGLSQILGMYVLLNVFVKIKNLNFLD